MGVIFGFAIGPWVCWIFGHRWRVDHRSLWQDELIWRPHWVCPRCGDVQRRRIE